MFIEIMPPTIPAPEERHLLGHESCERQLFRSSGAGRFLSWLSINISSLRDDWSRWQTLSNTK